jgi:4-amino-4-deoxy-L-arabinose transferase-like glycosyltransferase
VVARTIGEHASSLTRGSQPRQERVGSGARNAPHCILSSLKPFWPVTFGLLLAMAILQIASVRQESQTWDEGIHLAAGYSYLKTGDLRMNPEHPPLGKYLNAIPLLFLPLRLPLDHPSWAAGDAVEFGREFLYHNTTGADTILFAGRLVTILLTLAFGLGLALWTRREFGTGVALFALTLFAFDPNLIAHGRYVTSDLIEALFFFAASVIWYEYLRTGRRSWMILSGVVLGLAVASKFSGLLLLPVFGILYLIDRGQGGRRPLLSLLGVSLLAYVVIAAVYAPEARSFLPGIRVWDHSLRSARAGVRAGSMIGNLLIVVSPRLGLGHSYFFEGLSMVGLHNAEGHEAYLLGSRSELGWWYYFPVVFAVKTPTGLLLGLVAAAFVMIRGMKAQWLVLIVPPATYFAASMVSHINIGVRHLLPIYPFLSILAAAVLWRHRRILTVIVALVVIESLLVFPYYLAFFNLPSGGPSNGIRYLVDSNLDWGQDLRRLKTYLDKQGGGPPVCLGYFGNAVPDYYGIRADDMRTNQDVAKDGPPNCLVAVSATPMMGMYVDDTWSWVRQYRPLAKIGYSIYVFDMRRK